MDFWISQWISGYQSGFLDFTVDFWISAWISGFQLGFLDFSLDFWISVWISADGVRDFFHDGPVMVKMDPPKLVSPGTNFSINKDPPELILLQNMDSL